MDEEKDVSDTFPLEANDTNKHQESEHEEADEKTTEEILDRSLLCGWGKWRPKFLQPLSRPSVFLIVLVVYAMTAGVVSGLTAVNIPDIEKEFGFSSKQSALILLTNDIGGMVMLPFISFYGAHGKKPKWIGIGALVTGIGVLLMALPKLMIGNYSVPGLTQRSNLCNIGLNDLAGSCSGPQGYGSADKYLAIFCLAQIVIGLGITPLWPLSPAYLDENLNPKMSPIYLGVWFVSMFLGRGFGYAVGGTFSRTFTNIALPAGVTVSREDPRWIGAWWLGFFVFAWFAIIPGVFLICFPREMPKYRKRRLEAMDAGKLPPANNEIGKGLVGLLRSLIDLLKNKTYVFSCLGLTIELIFAAALRGFYTKIIVLKFGGSLSKIALLSAAVFIPGNTLGVGIGSLIMKKLPIADSVKRAAQYLIIMGVALTIFSSIWLLPGCNSTNVVGSATNCSCVRLGNQTISTSTNASSTAVLNNFESVSAGRCDRQCKNLVLFLALSAITLMISFTGAIPQRMLTMRCVADNQRAFGQGIMTMNARLLSFIPGPIILGSIIDSSCLLWGKDDCGNQGNCLEYDVDKISKSFFIFALVAASKPIKFEKKPPNNNENVELTQDSTEKA
eukprot:gene17325-8903_t